MPIVRRLPSAPAVAQASHQPNANGRPRRPTRTHRRPTRGAAPHVTTRLIPVSKNDWLSRHRARRARFRSHRRPEYHRSDAIARDGERAHQRLTRRQRLPLRCAIRAWRRAAQQFAHPRRVQRRIERRRLRDRAAVVEVEQQEHGQLGKLRRRARAGALSAVGLGRARDGHNEARRGRRKCRVREPTRRDQARANVVGTSPPLVCALQKHLRAREVVAERSRRARSGQESAQTRASMSCSAAAGRHGASVGIISSSSAQWAAQRASEADAPSHACRST